MPQSFDAAGNLTFVEFVGDENSPQEQFEADRTRAIRVFDVPWDKRHAMAVALLGYSQRSVQFPFGQPQQNAQAFPAIVRKLPHVHPVYTDVNNVGGFFTPFLYAQKVSIKGVGYNPANAADGLTGIGQTAVAKYTKARLTVEYGTFTYNILTDAEMDQEPAAIGDQPFPVDESTLRRFVTKIARPNVDVVTTPNGVWKVVNLGNINVPVKRGIYKSVPSEMFQITWHQIPEECIPCALVNPSNATGNNNYLSNYLGKVNSETFAGYPRGTLLLVSVELRPFRNPFGRRQYDITYNIKHFQPGFDVYRPTIAAGHNWIWFHTPTSVAAEQATGWGWLEVTMDGQTNQNALADGKNPFDYLPFNRLFKPI